MQCFAVMARARPLQETDTERRLRESQVVDERITPIYNIEDFRRESQEVCLVELICHRLLQQFCCMRKCVLSREQLLSALLV